jgi:hypothetical protein
LRTGHPGAQAGRRENREDSHNSQSIHGYELLWLVRAGANLQSIRIPAVRA